MQYLHSFFGRHLVMLALQLLLVEMMSQSYICCCCANPQWIFALSNFAFCNCGIIFAVVTLTSLIFAVVTLASAICCRYISIGKFNFVTASVAISAARIVPSKIFAVVTASVSMDYYTCVRGAASPDNATAAASPLVSHKYILLARSTGLMQYLHSFLVAASCANVGSCLLK
jgi:hypothetical protein